MGDSLAAGMAQTRHSTESYEVHDEAAAKANPSIMAASGRTTDQTLAVINANPQKFAGPDGVILSTGISNDLMAKRPLDDAMTNVASQLDALSKAGAKVALIGVGSGVPGYQEANARLKQIADAYHIPFTGEPATTQGGRVHPKDYNAVFGQFNFGEQPQQPPGTAKTIDDVTGTIQKAEGGGDFILFGHEGQPYDPKTMPTKEGYYGFPDWAGATTSSGPTHAAGGAQWEPDTWKKAVEGFTQTGAANQLGHTPDFRNPADQKAVFNYWAARRYKELTGRDIVADDNAGHVDWAALGPEWESLKNGLPGGGGGGTAGMTVGNLPSYQQYAQLSQQQRDLLQQQIKAQQEAIAGMNAGDPKQRALADQLMQKQLQLMDKYEDMIAHPPTQKPQDMISNFGSIATLIGIFAGRFAHRPMVASLNAAGAAMQAMNDNDYQQYQNAFNQWKTQAGMTSTLLGMESSAYKNIMEDKRLDMDEKFKLLDEQMKMYQNAQGMIASERGDLDKQWEIAEKTEQLKDQHDLHVQQITEAKEKEDQAQALNAAVTADDQAWLKDHPEANGVVPPEVHLDNLARRKGEVTEKSTPQAEGERQVMAAVAADDQAWLADPKNKDAKEVPADVHYQHYLARKKQLSETTAAGMRISNNPQALALQKFMQENPAATASQIQDFIARSHPGRSGIAMAMGKYMEENPTATAAELANYYAGLTAEVAGERGFATGPQGNAVRAFNVSIEHLATMTTLSKALENTDNQTLNYLKNTLATEFGGTAKPNFETAKQIVGQEVSKAALGGIGTGGERQALESQFSAASTPAQLLSVVDTLKTLIAGQLNGYRLQYQAATGLNDFDEKFLSEDTRRELSKERGSPAAPAGGTPPQAAVDYLKQHPEAREQFDQKYGAGAAARVLGQ
ncbi:MAG TPA: SGNH/GDSL hydrolase family protein [Stellaceae bacterium]